MSFSSQHLFTNSPARIALFFATAIKNPNPSPPIFSRHISKPPHFQISVHRPLKPLYFTSFKAHQSRIKAYESNPTVQRDGFDNFNFDSILSIAELLCLVSSAIVSISFAVNYTILSSKKGFLGVMGNRVLVLGAVMLVGGVVIGAWIRRRQWRRICRGSVTKGGESFNLIERIEKLEEDLRSSATIIRVLSRQLEKLGIRFRVTRKTLKEPIAETAALAQKNSEATRALAVQEDILEKELGEIQKVLLAMQDQQQKQLELILAIGKAGRLWEGRRGPILEEDKNETSKLAEGLKQVKTHQTQSSGTSKGANNDRA